MRATQIVRMSWHIVCAITRRWFTKKFAPGHESWLVGQGSTRNKYFESHIEQTGIRLAEVQSLLTNQSSLIDDVAAIAHRAAQGFGSVTGHSFPHTALQSPLTFQSSLFCLYKIILNSSRKDCFLPLRYASADMWSCSERARHWRKPLSISMIHLSG